MTIFVISLIYVVLAYLLENVTATQVTFTRRLHVDIDAYTNSQIGFTTGIAHQGLCGKLCKEEHCLAFAYNSAHLECTLYDRAICEAGPQSCSANDQDTCSSGQHATHFSSTMYFSKNLDRQTMSSLSTCADVPTTHCSGVYPMSTFDVYCDMDTADGPWTVIANRYDGSLDFFRNWDDYKVGFGNLRQEFWIGFENLRTYLTPTVKLRIVMVGWDNTTKQVDYSAFSVGTEVQKYALSSSGFSSPDGLTDCLSYHNGYKFSTPDEDNDAASYSCPDRAHGAWWYRSCIYSNLFGKYEFISPSYSGMVWKYFYTNVKYATVKKAKMMIQK